ncbi:site-specific integrase [Pseudorhodoferax sp. Leaf267]|uniref:site-specific integrase n=1 Tax=Pseudorhodoferax sp. Leaf267 TaxID=1736316 RepID=UPI0006FA4FDC|nr:site-specific integrase [Pseudorhodoferax sp. Leaf267]KQP23349.1 integrase [Pseudorhodoferax sp. Leaf267]
MDDQLQGASAAPGTINAGTVDMLRAVLADQTYEAVATAHGVSRTVVERQIKALAARLADSGRVEGLSVEASSSVRRLRQHSGALLRALDLPGQLERCVEPRAPCLSDDDIAAGAHRIRARSRQPLEDVALYYLLLSTGARPLEIARLQVRDYLLADGSVRRFSEIRGEIAITGRARPLVFGSARLREALDAYLADRWGRQRGVGDDATFRGLAPNSRLFLSPSGCGYAITAYGAEGQHRYQCRAIWDRYRTLFRHADHPHLTALTARQTLAARLYARGADEAQIGLLFGISERRHVREQFPRRVPTLAVLMQDLV